MNARKAHGNLASTYSHMLSGIRRVIECPIQGFAACVEANKVDPDKKLPSARWIWKLSFSCHTEKPFDLPEGKKKMGFGMPIVGSLSY